MSLIPKESSGIALPTVLVALLTLSALALAMTVSSRNDVVLSGLEVRSLQTLQAADAALNYSLGISANFADTVSQPVVDLHALGLPFDATIRVDFEPPPRLPPAGIRVTTPFSTFTGSAPLQRSRRSRENVK